MKNFIVKENHPRSKLGQNGSPNVLFLYGGVIKLKVQGWTKDTSLAMKPKIGKIALKFKNKGMNNLIGKP